MKQYCTTKTIQRIIQNNMMNNKQRTIQKNNKYTIDKTMKTILKTIHMNNDFNNMKTILYKNNNQTI